MPLVDYSIEIVRDVTRALNQQGRHNLSVLTLSHPDLVIHPDRLDQIFKGFPFARTKLRLREDAAATINWHKAHSITDKIIDTQSFFAALGYKFTAVDMVEGRGGEIIHDLSEPWPDSFLIGSGFDLVFDCITNQCFNVAQAMKNAWEATKIGGYCIHVTPVQMVNQGFWNVSPAAYHDFYAANHGEIIRFEHPVGVYTRIANAELSKTKRERVVLDDTMNVVVTKKHRREPIVWPIMTKFQLFPTCQK